MSTKPRVSTDESYNCFSGSIWDAYSAEYREYSYNSLGQLQEYNGYPGDHITIGVNGIELHVEEPAHVILDYIKDPHAPLLGEEQYERNPNILDYQKKYGDEEGWKRFKEVMHLN